MNEKPPLPKESTQRESHTADFEGKTIDIYKLISFAEQVEPTTVSTFTFENTKQNSYWHDSQGEWFGPQDIIGGEMGSATIYDSM